MVVTLFCLIDPSTPEAAYSAYMIVCTDLCERENLIHKESFVKLILN